MKVRVVAFASASDLLGAGPVDVPLADGARLSDLATHLHKTYPDLETIWPRLAIAVDGTLVRDDDPALAENAEVALLPPVSGGLDDGNEPATRVALTDTAIDVAAVERTVAHPSCGAVILFLGTVRNHHTGRTVARLTYSAYRSMARVALERIVAALEDGDDSLRVAIVHRLGDVPVGEASVVIAAASPHRQAAYAASREALERLKREVPIWKREHYADGTVVWREEEPLPAPA